MEKHENMLIFMSLTDYNRVKDLIVRGCHSEPK